MSATAFGVEGMAASRKPSSFESWFARETATGNWGGSRDKLEDQGVTIASNYTADIGGNPVGGLKKTAKYSGYLNAGIALDFEKIVSIEGLALTASNCLLSGRDLSGEIGNFFGVQEIYAPGDYFFVELNLSLSLLDNTIILETGRLLAADVFAYSDLYGYYLNAGINSNPGAIWSNIFFPDYNEAAWAWRATYQPNKEWLFTTAMYNADTRVEDIDRHGADFSFAMDNGFLAITQLAYKHNQSRNEQGSPGSTTFGCYYQSSKFEDFADPNKHWNGNYGFYLMFDQMIYKDKWPEYRGSSYHDSNMSYGEWAKEPYEKQTAMPLDRPKGLTFWGAAYLAPLESINIQTYQLASGLLYQGLFPKRDYDVTAFCFILGNFSDQLEGQGMEMVLELNHRFQIGPWFYVTPDIQYVINPDGRTDIDDALVVGFELSVNF